VALIVGSAACARAPEGGPAASSQAAVSDSTLLARIDVPTLIGFFRPAVDSADADSDGYNEGVAHIEFAISDGQQCLGRDSSTALMVIDTAVRISQGTRVDTIRFPLSDSLPYGVYLVAPDRRPFLVRAFGPSQVISATLAAVPTYFGRAPCDGP
jgi:hypothetical protein